MSCSLWDCRILGCLQTPMEMGAPHCTPEAVWMYDDGLVPLSLQTEGAVQGDAFSFWVQ